MDYDKVILVATFVRGVIYGLEKETLERDLNLSELINNSGIQGIDIEIMGHAVRLVGDENHMVICYVHKEDLPDSDPYIHIERR